MSTNEAKELIEKYKAGTLNADEQAVLDSWYLKTASTEEITVDERVLEQKLDKIWERLAANERPTAIRRKLPLRRLAAAAALLAVMGVGLYLYLNREKITAGQELNAANRYKNDVKPGGNKAVLTLSDGREIELDGASNGRLALQSGVKISKTADGNLLYEMENQPQEKTLAFNTIRTPRGGQYQVALPDGTKVWLNAGSSLRFPTVFTTAERKVELTGEAYFEVTKNPSKPFKVESGEQEIEVLGTHFNVNAYANEQSVKTTLFEGAVRLNAQGAVSERLKPGEAAAFSSDHFSVFEAKGDESIAWKNGLFQFEDADIATIMRQLERWYDVEVEYRGSIPKDTFRGKVPRNVNLSQVLDILETSGIRFVIRGKKIIVN